MKHRISRAFDRVMSEKQIKWPPIATFSDRRARTMDHTGQIISAESVGDEDRATADLVPRSACTTSSPRITRPARPILLIRYF